MRKTAPALLLALVAASPAVAQDAGGIAVGGRAGTTGFGVEVAFPVTPHLGVRVAGTGGGFDLDFESDEVEYEGEVQLASLLAVADLHPLGGAFRVSLGALVHDNTLEGTAPVRDLLLDEGIQVPPGIDLGRLEAEASVDPVAPYAGIGWGYAPRGPRGFTASLDLGAAWHGEPDVDLRYTGPLEALLGRPEVDALLAEEERELEAELADYDVYPVVAVTLGYRF